MGVRTIPTTRCSKLGIFLVVILASLACLSSGCGGLQDRVSERYNTSTNAFAEPGLYEQTNGTTQAVGRLAFRDTGGGFWAVVDTALPQRVDSAPVVAVVIPDSEMASTMESYRGKYVSVTGTKGDSSNASEAGPVIQATSIALLKEKVAE